MAKSREDLAVILALDNVRRGANADELIALAQSYYADAKAHDNVDPYCYSRAITGVPSNRNRTYRVMPNSFTHHNFHDAAGAIKSRRTRCVGGDVTVIHADGTTELRSPTSFRKERIHARQRTHATQVRQIGAAQSYEDRLSQLGAVGNID